MYRIGYAPGTCDFFHIGHLNLLRNARKHCDVLIAGVVADEIAFRVKGVVPVIPIADRLEIVRCIKFVDSAYPHVKDDILAVWQELPSICCSRVTTGRAPRRAGALNAISRRLVSSCAFFPTPPRFRALCCGRPYNPIRFHDPIPAAEFGQRLSQNSGGTLRARLKASREPGICRRRPIPFRFESKDRSDARHCLWRRCSYFSTGSCNDIDHPRKKSRSSRSGRPALGVDRCAR
jgi:glycerol-3-phosphate cytidylyltransferase